MTVQDARARLDDIRRLQDRTRDELVRNSFALPYMLLMAVGLFIGYASTDVPDPWDDLGVLLGFGLFAAVVIVQTRTRVCRAAVRPRSVWVPGPREAVFHLAWGFSHLLVFFACVSAGSALGLPAPGTAAAAVTAVSYVAATPLMRRIALAVMRQENG